MNLSIVCDDLVRWISFVSNFFEIMNQENTSNGSNVNFKNIFLFVLAKNASGKSYNIVMSDFLCDSLLDVNRSTVVKYRSRITNNFMEQLNRASILYFYDLLKTYNLHFQKKDTRRMFAVDGTYLCFSKNKDTINFQDSPNEKYKIGLMSCIYDVINDIPLSYKLYHNHNEREALLSELHLFNRRDIVILDRGYYGRSFIHQLKKRDIDVICRLPESLSLCKDLEKKNLREEVIDYKLFGVSFRFKIIKFVVMFECKECIFYVGTTLVDEDINMKIVYHWRWDSETHFRFIKYDLSLNRIKSRKLSYIEQDISIHLFIMIMAATTQFFCKLFYLHEKFPKIRKQCNNDVVTTKSSDVVWSYKDDNQYNLNKAVILNVVHTKIMPSLVVINDLDKTANNILNFMSVITQFKIPVIKDRHFKRISVFPLPGWSYNSNRDKITEEKKKAKAIAASTAAAAAAVVG
jgi:hypothetical protein